MVSLNIGGVDCICNIARAAAALWVAVVLLRGLSLVVSDFFFFSSISLKGLTKGDRSYLRLFSPNVWAGTRQQKNLIASGWEREWGVALP